MYKIKLLNEIADVIYDSLPGDQFSASKDEAAPDAYLVRSADMHGKDLGGALAVARAGAGTNNIPVEECTEAGIVVFNTPGANANAVKELAIAGLLLASRRIADSIEWAKTLKGKGAEVPGLVEKGKNQFVGPELAGKRLGVIGLGAIGVLVANAATALNMEVIGFDPFISVQSAWALSRSIKQAASEEEVLATSDYVTVHIPLMDSTRGSFNAKKLGLMKPGAALLNFSRGELCDEGAVLAALESGGLRAYVTDFPTDKMLCHDRIIAIPHLGASTPESEDNCADMAARQLHDYLTAGIIKNSVNFPACDPGRPVGVRLILIHDNVPNMIAQITSLVATENINIDNMVNSSKGSVGYTSLDLSAAPGEGLVGKLRGVPNMRRVRVITE